MSKRFFFLMSVFVLTGSAAKAQQNPLKLKPGNVKEVVASMSLEEKVNTLVGLGMHMTGLDMPSGTAIGQVTDKVAGAAGITGGTPRFGIPNTVVSDGPAGLRIDPKRKDDPNTYYATAFPIGSLLASSWDPGLVEQIGKAIGNEAREYGVDLMLMPGMNIHRNPLGGRNFEYYSEDPLLTGKMAAAMVNGVESVGIGTSIKHFAANNQETNRNSVNTIVSERALREIYLRGFEIAVKESQPWSVMSSYNLINGTYTSQSFDLLTTILRKEWGFKGYVMTDWFGGKNPIEQVLAGNDLLMPGTKQQKDAITDAFNKGLIDIKVINQNVERILNYVLESQAYKNYKFSNKPDLKGHAALVRSAAAEGAILLKNEGHVLPLKAKARIAAYGNSSYRLYSGGTGSGDVNEAYTVSLTEGLTGAGFTLDGDVVKAYNGQLAAYDKEHPKKSFIEEFMSPTPPAPELDLDAAMVAKKADQSDIALFTIGRNAGEGKDRKPENDYYLSDKEKALLKTVADAYHAKGKKLVVIINSGGLIDVASWASTADAILFAWQGGEEAGNSIADVVSGKVNPSGKLTSTIPMRYEDVPSAKNFPGKEFPDQAKATGMFGMKEIPGEVTYEEGIYVGYRYYNSFKVTPAYPFGFGLSYTTFKYDGLKLNNSSFNGQITASVTITNTGKLAGREVVQLYLSAPAGKIDKPVEELKAFGKTKLLKPGESQTLSFTLKPSDLASFDTESSSWIADAGNYVVRIGASSEDIRAEKPFVLNQPITVEVVNKVMAPKVQINELKRN